MKIGKELQKILDKTYAPLSTIERSMGRYDLRFDTDQIGRPILLFAGKANAQGRIVGERFTRRIVTNEVGNVIKDHWDNQGKIS
ncbi:hypothetical protein [Mucilaginibacter aquatilis]|uniref:Uncharacterized protein n=1 Tax=Mucilaginibacter aquatilis TaxID=1517760 RepID=A0A6I4ICJ0_9SPHI|nr:hypothetical protein [Mucilaginibacter aquatilis]MVN92965.1 hypothetical protein [Mucilaginibacter aquatilis]